MTPEEITDLKENVFEKIWDKKLKGKKPMKHQIKAAMFEAMQEMYRHMERI